MSATALKKRVYRRYVTTTDEAVTVGCWPTTFVYIERNLQRRRRCDDVTNDGGSAGSRGRSSCFSILLGTVFLSRRTKIF